MCFEAAIWNLLFREYVYEINWRYLEIIAKIQRFY